ncbi:hypothetical protein Hamer_G014881 [Homarus americanus]|uniref:Uncharacterized protein n=1 Tax=Homarus americanus TaxID=6706 RepID=A0A8J5MNI6_HOMAM|nr:hypothetical protein Hamer_G014881 [Homarus americanus]
MASPPVLLEKPESTTELRNNLKMICPLMLGPGELAAIAAQEQDDSLRLLFDSANDSGHTTGYFSQDDCFVRRWLHRLCRGRSRTGLLSLK